MLKQTKVDKGRAVMSYLYIYAGMVLVLSYTAFKSPFVASNYTNFILVNSMILFLSSYYMIGWKTTKQWWTENMRQARYRVELKRAVEVEIRKKMGIE